jgi:hypothetical protein
MNQNNDQDKHPKVKPIWTAEELEARLKKQPRQTEEELEKMWQEEQRIRATDPRYIRRQQLRDEIDRKEEERLRKERENRRKE